MLKNRQEGLTTLHALCSALWVGAWFIALVIFMRLTGWIEILETVNLNIYMLGTLGGMLASLRLYQLCSDRLAKLNWLESIRLAKQQMLRLALVLFAVVFVMQDTALSRLFLGVFLGTTALWLIILNRFLPGWICRLVFRQQTVPTLFIGGSQAIHDLNRWIEEKEFLGIHPVGFVTAETNPIHIPKVPLLGTYQELSSILQNTPVGQILLLQNYLTKEQTLDLIDLSQQLGCRLRIYNNLEVEYQHPILVEQDGEHTFLSLQDEPLENPINRLLKRILDITVSLPVVAFVLPPLTLMVWIFQKLQSPGPVFYTQPRSGITKKRFQIIKFRTMHISEENERKQAKQATRDDNRVYGFGRFLRRSSLDELPQFINVLLGEMSVAGPRPHLLDHDAEFSRQLKTYQTRHFVKPGITGLAQCRGYRGEILEIEALRQRINWDIFYINNWSIWMDIKIILATVKTVLFPPKTAY